MIIRTSGLSVKAVFSQSPEWTPLTQHKKQSSLQEFWLADLRFLAALVKWLEWYSSTWETHLRAMEHHLLYGMTRVTCHPTQVNTPHLNPSHTSDTQFAYRVGMEG